MFGKKAWPAAAVAAWLVVLAMLIGCGGEESVASKSAAAFEEAQKRGETFGGEGHAHGGHGASPVGGENAEPAEAAVGEEHAGHGAAAPAAPGEHHGGHGAAGGGSAADHSAMGHRDKAHAGGHAPQRSGSTRTEATGAGTQDHTGHGAPAAQTPTGHAGHGPAAQAPAGQTGHAGHSATGGETPARPVEDLPAQPASILRPDSVDAPAATSVVDARRSAEMNQAMSGGHGGHGAGTYRQIDAGREPGAYEGSEPQTPGAGPQQHDHGAAPAAEAAVYACPMHPEVTSDRPGTCPKCGMKLVERRKE